MADKHYKGEVGTEILVDCGCVITGASDITLKIKKPDGTKVDWDAIIDGTNFLKHTTIASDFSLPGKYYLQASLTISSWAGLGETTTFIIYSSFR